MNSQEWDIIFEIGTRQIGVTMDITMKLQEITEFLIDEGLVPIGPITYLGKHSQKFGVDPQTWLGEIISTNGDALRVLTDDDEIKKYKNINFNVCFRIVKSGKKLEIELENYEDLQLNDVVKLLIDNGQIKPNSKKIVFVNDRNKKEARMGDLFNALELKNNDKISVFEDAQYQKYQIEKERANYSIINQKKNLIDLVKCQQLNHAPSKINFICQLPSCDQLPACCQFCFKGIHNSHTNTDDFLQFNEIDNLDFTIYQKLVLQVKDMQIKIKEQFEGLNKLIELLDPKKQQINFMGQPGYTTANLMGYAIRFLKNIPNISKSVNKMKIDVQYKIDKLFRNLMVGLKYDDIVKNIQPDSHIEYQFENSKFLKQRKMVLDLEIQPDFKLEKINIECSQMAPVAMIRNIVINKIITSNKNINPDDLIRQPVLFYAQKEQKFGFNWEKVCQIVEADNDILKVFWGQEKIDKFIQEQYN